MSPLWSVKESHTGLEWHEGKWFGVNYPFKGILSFLLIIIWKLLLHKIEFSWKGRTDERGICSVSHGSGVNLCEVMSCLEEFLLSFFISALRKHYLDFFHTILPASHSIALPPSLTPVPGRCSLLVSHCSLRGSSGVHSHSQTTQRDIQVPYIIARRDSVSSGSRWRQPAGTTPSANHPGCTTNVCQRWGRPVSQRESYETRAETQNMC